MSTASQLLGGYMGDSPQKALVMLLSYTQSRERRVAGNRYSRWLFTSADRLHFSHERKIDEYDVTVPVARLPVTSQIEMWWRHNAISERISMAKKAKLAIDHCFSGSM